MADTSQLESALVKADAAGDTEGARILAGEIRRLRTAPSSPSNGMISPGNIDLTNRPKVKNPDGSISTVRSMGINDGQNEVLIPTVHPDGYIMSNDEAVDHYRKTGQHLGKFTTPQASDAYAEQLHQDQAKMYVPQPQASGLDNFLGGLKKAGTDTVLGVKQLGAMAGIGDQAALEKEAADVKVRDAAMMDTGAGMAGNVIGNIGMALLPGGVLKAASKVLPMIPGLASAGTALLAPKTLGGAAALGAATGIVQPTTSNEDRVTNAVIGGIGGSAGNLAARGISRVLNPQTAAAVTALMKQGVTPTPGQALGGFAQRTEDKLMSIPLLGDAITAGRKRAESQLNRAAYERALVGTGVDASKLPVGPEGISAVRDAVGKQYDNLLPKLAFTPDAQFTQEIGKIQQMVTGMGSKEQAKFNSLLNDVIANKVSPNGSMIGETYKVVESKLTKEAKRFSGSNDAYQQELGSALGEVLNSMKSNLARSNPQYAKELAQANSNYANYVRLRTAGAMAGDQSSGFSPAQLASAVRKNDSSVGGGATAIGKALMQDLSSAGQKVLSSKYPDSGTAGRGIVAGVLGSAAYANPATLAVGAAALPYAPGVQKVIAQLLTQRPDLARKLGNAFVAGAPYGAIPGAAIANSQE